MITIRWASFVLALVTLYALGRTEVSLATLGLAAFLAVFIIIHCWTWGAFERWVQDIPEGHPDELHHHRSHHTEEDHQS